MENKTTYKIAREVANRAKYTVFRRRDGDIVEGVKYKDAVNMAVDMAEAVSKVFVAEACEWLKNKAELAINEETGKLNVELLADMFKADNAISKAGAIEILGQLRFNEFCRIYLAMRHRMFDNRFMAVEWVE